MTYRFLASVAMTALVGSFCAAARVGAQQPAFKTTAEALAVDVNVLDGSGTPVTGLGAADFDVRVDGKQRQVLNVQWISATAPAPAPERSVQAIPAGYASNQSATQQSGHLIVIAIDEVNLPPGALSNMQESLGAFIDRVSEANPTAVFGLGVRSTSTSFTTDREQLKKAVALMRGQQTQSGAVGGFFDMGLSTALRISQGDTDLVDAMVRRDCIVKDDMGRERCVEEIRMAANVIVQNATQEGQTAESRLRDLLSGLRSIDAPKTLVLVSQGFYVDGGASRIDGLASLAAAAQTTIYGLAVDESAFARRRATIGGASTADRLERIRGLENLASASRGTFLTLSGNGAPVLERVARELSGYYLLGVESDPADSDGRSHGLRVAVNRAGTTVRARRSFVRSGAADADRTPRQVVASALQAPFVSSGLPVRGVAVAFRDADPSKVQLLVHAEVGEGYSEARNLAIGFTVMDREGKVVGGQLGVTTVAPAVEGLASSLPYSAGTNLTPGEYTVKIAAVDGDRVGSVTWTVHAGLLDLEGASSTELVVGGPVLPIDLSHPTVDSQVRTGTLHGYFEIYGNDVRAFTTTFEIASDERAPAMTTADVAPLPVGSDRVIFSRTLNVEALPPGMYMLRAIVRRGDRTQRTLTRAFEVVRASSSATDSADAAPLAPRFLPIEPGRLGRPFNGSQLLEPSTLQGFRDSVSEAARPIFDQGVAQYQRGEYRDALATFRRAIRPDTDPTAPMAYLGATYALLGDDAEAANIWRTALVAGGDVPQVYVWLADSLVRRKAFSEAQPVLEDAVEHWPTDRRFLRLLAIVYAMSGRAGEAADLLNRSITSNPDDVESLALALEWLYSVSREGKAFRTRSEDLQLARTYAAQYLKTGGPDEALVRRWQEYFDSQKP